MAISTAAGRAREADTAYVIQHCETATHYMLLAIHHRLVPASGYRRSSVRDRAMQYITMAYEVSRKQR